MNLSFIFFVGLLFIALSASASDFIAFDMKTLLSSNVYYFDANVEGSVLLQSKAKCLSSMVLSELEYCSSSAGVVGSVSQVFNVVSAISILFMIGIGCILRRMWKV